MHLGLTVYPIPKDENRLDEKKNRRKTKRKKCYKLDLRAISK